MTKYRSKAFAEARGEIAQTSDKPTKNKPTKAKSSQSPTNPTDVNQSTKITAKNSKLHDAKRSKKDEFYTQLADIENELRHYKAHFFGKTVYCNCDDPYESNFFQYFARNFHHLGLKKLITTGYATSPIAGTQLSLFDDDTVIYRKAHKIEITDIENLTNIPTTQKLSLDVLNKRNKGVKITNLKDDGDFRSKESLKCLAECDIVVTNPPFSLFREYVAQLIERDKKFIIVGHQNSLTYKEIFPLIKNNQIWLGFGFKGGAAHFINTHYENYATATDKKEGMIRVSGVVWFTNLDIAKRHEFLTLYKTYHPDAYPKYDNYNAIEVSKTKDIPIDYDGIMGVPITFLDKYNPEQFELIGATESEGRGFSNGLWLNSSTSTQALVDGKKVYKRLFIKHKR